MNLCPTLDIFHLISKNERVPVGIYFSLLDLNSSNFMFFSMKRVSRFYLICVGGFSRGFHRHLERLWQKSSLFCQYILGFPRFHIIQHVCFEKRQQLEYFWLTKSFNTQFTIKMSLVAASNQKLPTLVFTGWHQSGPPLLEVRTKSKMSAEHFPSYWLKN